MAHINNNNIKHATYSTWYVDSILSLSVCSSPGNCCESLSVAAAVRRQAIHKPANCILGDVDEYLVLVKSLWLYLQDIYTLYWKQRGQSREGVRKTHCDWIQRKYVFFKNTSTGKKMTGRETGSREKLQQQLSPSLSACFIHWHGLII